MSYYAGNVTAEMATVLRKNATILIRLREKMECNVDGFFTSECSAEMISYPNMFITFE